MEYKVTVLAYFKVLLRHLRGGTEKTSGNREPVSGLRLKSRASRIRMRCTNHSAVTNSTYGENQIQIIFFWIRCGCKILPRNLYFSLVCGNRAGLSPYFRPFHVPPNSNSNCGFLRNSIRIPCRTFPCRHAYRIQCDVSTKIKYRRLYNVNNDVAFLRYNE